MDSNLVGPECQPTYERDSDYRLDINESSDRNLEQLTQENVVNGTGIGLGSG